MCGAGCEPQSRRMMRGGGSRTHEQNAWGWVRALERGKGCVGGSRAGDGGREKAK